MDALRVAGGDGRLTAGELDARLERGRPAAVLITPDGEHAKAATRVEGPAGPSGGPAWGGKMWRRSPASGPGSGYPLVLVMTSTPRLGNTVLMKKSWTAGTGSAHTSLTTRTV